MSSTTSLVQGVPKQSGPPPVTIHRSPEVSKTSWAPPLEEIVTVGAGFVLVSSALENSTTLLTVDTHRSPEASKATPKMGVLGKSEMVVTGRRPARAGQLALGVLVDLAPSVADHPEVARVSKAIPKGLASAPDPAKMVTAGTGSGMRQLGLGELEEVAGIFVGHPQVA